MKLKKLINIFGDGIKSVSPNINAQRRVNVYYDIRKDGDKNQFVLINTPGLTKLLTLPTYPIRGMKQVGIYAYVISGNTLYLISPSGSYCSLGTINTNTSTPVSMDANETQLCAVDGSFGYVLNNIGGLENLIATGQEATILNLQFLVDINNNVINQNG